MMMMIMDVEINCGIMVSLHRLPGQYRFSNLPVSQSTQDVNAPSLMNSLPYSLVLLIGPS